MRTTIFVAVGRGPALPQLTIDHRPSCAVRCGMRDAHEVRRIAANIAKLPERLLDDAGRRVRGDQQRVVEAAFLSGPGRFEGVVKVLV